MLFRAVVVLAILCAISAFTVPVTRRASALRSLSMEGEAAPAAPAPAEPAAPATPPAPVVEFSRSLPFLIKPKNLDGMIGNAEFDPFGFCETFDPKWMREAEIKHGRVAMLATVGWLAQSSGFHVYPDPFGIYGVDNPIDAVFKTGASPLLQIIFAIGAAEWVNHDGKISMMDMHKDSDRVVGEFSHPIYGAWYLKGKSEAQIADLKLKELKNGRLAMMAIGGLVHQTIVSGSETLGAFPNSQLYGL
mmetsp:Transcript_9934/g.16643  ORF Transcript_9934/g.16643 Transcript_9934/m.16643 type:complete len:247 (-) Transcript_9934:235-975(-)